MRSYILSTSEYSTKAYKEKLARVYPYFMNFILNIWVMNISCSFFHGIGKNHIRKCRYGVWHFEAITRQQLLTHSSEIWADRECM